MSGSNVVELITRQVLERIGTEVDTRVQGAVADVQAEVQRRVAEALDQIPAVVPVPSATWPPTTDDTAIPIPDPAPPQTVPAAADARSRAGRTLFQGAIATVLVSVLMALAQILGTGTVDIFTGEGWKVIGGTVSAAGIMAVTSFIQRIVSPPKDR